MKTKTITATEEINPYISKGLLELYDSIEDIKDSIHKANSMIHDLNIGYLGKPDLTIEPYRSSLVTEYPGAQIKSQICWDYIRQAAADLHDVLGCVSLLMEVFEEPENDANDLFHKEISNMSGTEIKEITKYVELLKSNPQEAAEMLAKLKNEVAEGSGNS